MVSRLGQAVRFNEKDVRAMGRPASGVAGMKLRADDEVIEVDIAADDAELLVVTENGWGKRTRVSEYPVKGRGTMGVKTVQLAERKGTLAGARIVRDGYQVMLISDGGTVIRMAADEIKRSGRATQGVIVMRLREGEHVSTLAPVVGSDDDDAERVVDGGDRRRAPGAADEQPAGSSVHQRHDDHDAEDHGGEHDQPLDDRLDRRAADVVGAAATRRPAGPADGGRRERARGRARRRGRRRACAPIRRSCGGSRASRGTRSGSGRRSSSCSSPRSRAASAGSGAGR